MSKIRLFLKDHSSFADQLLITEKDHLHKIQKVLRLAVGDEILVFDGKGSEFCYRISASGKKLLTLRSIRLSRHEERQKQDIILAFPLMKEYRIDFILQKATELGVTRFVPFISSRCTIHKSPRKTERWQRIIEEAVRQSERLWLPALETTVTFDELATRPASCKLFGLPSGKNPKTIDITVGQDILIAVGPEGDFSEKEKERLTECDFVGIKLSPYLLRTETAAITAVGIIKGIFDEN